MRRNAFWLVGVNQPAIKRFFLTELVAVFLAGEQEDSSGVTLEAPELTFPIDELLGFDVVNQIKSAQAWRVDVRSLEESLAHVLGGAHVDSASMLHREFRRTLCPTIGLVDLTFDGHEESHWAITIKSDSCLFVVFDTRWIGWRRGNVVWVDSAGGDRSHGGW